MTKLIKVISAPLISLIFLLNMSSAGMADTTVSAEVGFIFNTLLFLIVKKTNKINTLRITIYSVNIYVKH